MVQVIHRREKKEEKPSFGQEMMKGLMSGFQSLAEHKMKQDSLEKEYALKGQLEEKKNLIDLDTERKGYETMEKTFGKTFADVWKSSPTGGRTKLTEMAIDSILRGEDVNEILANAGLEETPTDQFGQIPDDVPQLQKGKVPKDFEWPDFAKRPAGFTPKTWADQKSEWRKENVPIFTDNSTKRDRLEKDVLATKKLTKLNESGKLPEDLERLLINPDTGDLYGAAQVLGFKSPEAQEWSKVIAQFQNRAKDAFGARVTNFDLQSYMQQFPGLINTPEGRKRILKMMDINWKLDQLYSKALDDTYKHYGLNGIPLEKADELARKMVSQETTRLKDEFEDLDVENQRESGQLGPDLSGKMVDVLDQSGKVVGKVDQSQVDQLPEGYRIR